MVTTGLLWKGLAEGAMCSESFEVEGTNSSGARGGTALDDGRATGALEVGEELQGMQRRARCRGPGASAGGGAGGQEGPASHGVLRDCGCGVAGEKRKLEGEEPSHTGEDKARPVSPQDSCSVADGILMHQSKKQRILRRRVTFNSESRMRLIARVAHYFVRDDAEREDEVRDEGEEEDALEEGEAQGGGAGAAEPMSEDDAPWSSGAPEEEVRTSAPSANPETADAGDRTPCGSEMEEGEEELACSEEMSWEEELELLSGGDRGDESVVTKTNDGPSLINVVTQSLIIGLVERRVRNVGDVLYTLRKCVVPCSFAVEEGDENKGGDVAGTAADKKQQNEAASSELSSCSSSSEEDVSDAENKRPKCAPVRRVPLRPEMIVCSTIFDMTHDHVKVLLGRITNNGRASLLPSTAQIGAPFIPALEFLLQSLKEAQDRNEMDRARLARLRQMQAKQRAAGNNSPRLAGSPVAARGKVAATV